MNGSIQDSAFSIQQRRTANPFTSASAFAFAFAAVGRTVGMLVPAMLLLTGPLAAQVRDITVAGAAQCAACRIELERVATIGSADDEHLYRQFSQLTRGATGYLVANGYTPGVVVVYDSAGAFVRTIGRPGGGPGELAEWSLIHVTAADTLLAASGGRITVFRTPDGEAVRSWHPQAVVWGLTSLRGGITAAALAPNARQETVRIFDPDGSRRASIFFDGALEHRDQLGQRLHSAGDTLLLVSATGSYELRAFDTDGALRWTVRREVDWFRPYVRQPPGALIRTPSLPDIVGAWVEGDRYLWVLLERPAEDWRPVGQSQRPDEVDFNTLFSSQLEVIDLESGQLLASQRMRWLLPAADGRPLVYTSRTGAYGQTIFDVWQVDLVPPPARGNRGH
jgi:hypothetical protein